MRTARFALTVACIAATLGCGGKVDKHKAKRPKCVPASGVVTYQGKPLDGATVIIYPNDPKGIAAASVSDASGQFDLQSFPPDRGAPPGKYKVSVQKVESQSGARGGGPSTAALPAHEAAEIQAREGAKAKAFIPEKFGDPETSGLTVEIPPEGNTNIKLDLN